MMVKDVCMIISLVSVANSTILQWSVTQRSVTHDAEYEPVMITQNAHRFVRISHGSWYCAKDTVSTDTIRGFLYNRILISK